MPMNNFADLVDIFLNMISLLIPIMFGLTFLYVLWGVIDAWIIHGGDQEKVAQGKNTLLVGIVALVVMSGIWGILTILQNSIF